MKRYYQLVSRWRRLIVCLWLLIIGGLSLGALNLQFTTNYRVFFSPENPQLQSFLAMQETYNKKDNVLFVLFFNQEAIFNPHNLSAIAELTEASWQMQHSIRVDSLTNFQYSEAEGDSISVFPLVSKPQQLDSTQLEKIKKIALHDPQLQGRLINPSADVTAVNVTFNIPTGQELTAIPNIATQAQQLAQKIQSKYPHIRIHITGIVMMDQALTDIPMQDMRKLVPLMFVLIGIILYLFFQHWLAVVSCLSVLFLCIGATMGMAGWVNLLLSPPTAVVPIIIMTIAVADSVHILLNYQNAVAAGQQTSTALEHSLKINFQAILLTSISTIIGFLGLNFSDVPPFRELGNLVALGTMIALLLSLSFLPAFILMLPKHKKYQAVKGQYLMHKISQFVLQKYKPILLVSSVVFVIFVGFIGHNRLNDQFINYFDSRVTFRQATEQTLAHLTGLYLLELELDAQDISAIFQTENLQTVEHFSQWLRLQPEIMHVDSITDTLKRINKNLFADQEAHYRLPDSPELAAQEILLFELSLPYGLDLTDKLNQKKSATRLSISLTNLSSTQILSLVQRMQQWFTVHGADKMQLTVSGTPLMFAYISQRNILSMLIGTSLALACISLLLLLVFKSIKMGLLSLIPNLAPAILAFGLWGVINGQIGMTLAVVSCMTLGIVIDDTVHFLSKFLHYRRVEQLSNEMAISKTFSSVGTALLITSCALIAGFLVLALSLFIPNADMGLLTAITIIFALLADFFVLPSLLLLGNTKIK